MSSKAVASVTSAVFQPSLFLKSKLSARQCDECGEELSKIRFGAHHGTKIDLEYFHVRKEDQLSFKTTVDDYMADGT